MLAKKLFRATDDLSRSERYIAALIILQTKAWAYYSVLMQSEVIWTTQVGTAATDGAYVYVNPDFFRGLPSDGQRAFLLAHEVGHIVLRHSLRGMAYRLRGFHSMQGAQRIEWHPQTWNMSGDYVINADLLAHGLEPIPAGLFDSKINRDALVDNVYIDLMNKPQPDQPNQPNQPGQPGQGDGEEQEGGGTADTSRTDDADDEGGADADGEGDGDADADGDADGEGDGAPQPLPHTGHDEHYEPQYDGDADTQQDAMEQDRQTIERAVDQTLDEIERQRGRQPGYGFANSGYRHADHHADGTIDWRAELAELVTRPGRDGEQNWSRINRRHFINYGVVSPTRKGSLERIVITNDMSSSVDHERVQPMVYAELAALMDTMNPTSGCLVLFTNSRVCKVAEVFSSSELLALETPTGGGTILSASLDWLEENGYAGQADVHLVFTDGELFGDDWRRLAKAGCIIILDRHPHQYTLETMREVGIRWLVASDEPLAA